MRRLGLGLALACLAACGGEDPPPPTPEPTPAPEAPEPELPVPRGRNLHVTSELTYESLPDAPHRLVATYQGAILARWAIERLNDEDGDRRIEYRAGARTFVLPQDSGESLEYLGAEREQVLRRMELRRVAMTLGLDELAWDAEGGLDLGDGLGRIERRELEDGGLELTCRTAEGTPEESLRVLAWVQHGKGRRPAELELWFGAAHVWSEEISNFAVESWFKERFFWPPDRVDEVGDGE